LLFAFAAKRLGTTPSKLHVEQLDAVLVTEFLRHIERDRGNGPVTRNVRLSAIKSFMRYIEYRLPAALEQVGQIRAIPNKRHEQKLIQHLEIDEVRAILNAPDLTTRLGIRDRAMLHLCFAAGLRVSELIGIHLESLSLRSPPSIRVLGKGRKERCLPLWKETVADLRVWLAVRGPVRCQELFVNADGDPMTRAGFEYIIDKHVRTAIGNCPALTGRSVSPHQLRHSCAVTMLRATRDIRKVALWLGHSDVRTTEIYLRMDAMEKLEAVEAVLPPQLRRGRFKAPDALIASLLEEIAPPSG
jgi:site-specific recombinase XerD